MQFGIGGIVFCVRRHVGGEEDVVLAFHNTTVFRSVKGVGEQYNYAHDVPVSRFSTNHILICI